MGMTFFIRRAENGLSLGGEVGEAADALLGKLTPSPCRQTGAGAPGMHTHTPRPCWRVATPMTHCLWCWCDSHSHTSPPRTTPEASLTKSWSSLTDKEAPQARACVS